MATHDVDEAVLTLIGSGQADTRPAIVKQTGLAASTVSAAVSRLVEAGAIAEADESVSTGGRRARRLVTSEGAGALALVELGAHHGLVALTDPTRGIGRATSLLIDIAKGPEAVLAAVMEEISRQEKAAGVRVGGLALAVPGPVDAERTRVIRPARMPPSIRSSTSRPVPLSAVPTWSMAPPSSGRAAWPGTSRISPLRRPQAAPASVATLAAWKPSPRPTRFETTWLPPASSTRTTHSSWPQRAAACPKSLPPSARRGHS